MEAGSDVLDSHGETLLQRCCKMAESSDGVACVWLLLMHNADHSIGCTVRPP